MRWYLPHHGVVNSNRPSKLRIVFDGSANQNGISLNKDILMKGPDFTNRLDAVLMKFRERSIAVSSDIQAMFHQIQIPENDRSWYRFLWPDDDGRIVDWRWTVHSFGAKPSPSIACHALNCGLVEQADDDVKEISAAARDMFYVDDHLDSSTDVETAQKKVEVLDQTCHRSGFVLRKWASNCPAVLKAIHPNHKVEVGSDVQLGMESHSDLPTLGMRWKPDSDKLTYRPPELTKVQNRRQLLSNMTKLFDPLGLVSPWILNCRLLVQTLCKLKLTWDETIPPEYLKLWENWQAGTQKVTEIEFDRCVTTDVNTTATYQLHVFSDSSMKGHGIAAYIRTHTPDETVSKLVYARSRVNPMKGETIPRAELIAATLGAKTTSKLKRELRLTFEKTINWTDSKIVLEYLRNESIKSQVFIINRLGTILTHTAVKDWRHVPGKDNPADIASRGGGAKELSSSLWQNGPDFLKEPEDTWPKETQDNLVTEHTTNRVYTAEKDDEVSKVITLLNDISEWERILRFTQVVLGAVHAKSSADARRQARLAVFRAIQRQYYVHEIERLRNDLPLKKSSAILKLCPELDADNILRVGGRLTEASLPHEGRHPIILPGSEPLVQKLIRRIHCMEGHVGRNHLIATVREEYWIIGMTTAVRTVLKRCVVCHRYQARLEAQKVGPLPQDRVSSRRAFENVGVDYFGPLNIAVGRRQEKRYGVVFSCNYTRAVHLEIARKLDTQSCLMTISRFINRRGRPKMFRSDNGTNLVGACKEMRQDLLKMNQELLVRDKLARDEIEWVFNPPQASHMGGHYERQIRSIRKILYGLVNTQILTEEELQTVMVKVEWIMNSRPLTTTSSADPNVVAITPNHLMGIKTVETDTTLTEGGDLYRSRWKRVNYITDQLWKKFHAEYVLSLQDRQKQQEKGPNLAVGDIVVVQDNSVGRAYWPIGRIISVNPSRDGLVRSCEVKTQAGMYTRPVTKLAKLLSE